MSDHPIHLHRLTGFAIRALQHQGERFYVMRLASGDELVTDFLVNQMGMEELQRQMDAAQCAHLAAGME